MDEKVDVRWVKIGGKECLKFQFGTNLTEKAAAEAIVAWERAFAERTGKITIVWGCEQMKAYESQARVRWTTALNAMKPQIDSIWLITTSSVIAMGASLMGAVTGFKIKTAKSESGISF